MGKVLVTGGAGFIGSHLIDKLIGENRVACLDNFDPFYDPLAKRRNIAHHAGDRNFELIEGDIGDRRLIKEVLSEGDIEIIFHEAAQGGVRFSIQDPIKTHDVNSTGTLNILEAAARSRVEKVIFASSSSVYGRAEYLPLEEDGLKCPISPYGVSKLLAEHYCRVFREVYGLKTISLRCFTVYGPRMRPDLAIATFVRNAIAKKPIEIFGDGSSTRDFTYVDDVVEAHLLAMRSGQGEYNIGSGERISVEDLARKIISLTGSSSEIRHTSAIRGDVEHTWADIRRAGRDLSYRPRINLDEGLRRYIAYVRREDERP